MASRSRSARAPWEPPDRADSVQALASPVECQSAQRTVSALAPGWDAALLPGLDHAGRPARGPALHAQGQQRSRFQECLDQQGVAGPPSAALQLLAPEGLPEPPQFNRRSAPDPGRQQRDGGFRSQKRGVQCNGISVQQRAHGHFVADRRLGHRHADRDPLPRQVALQLAELAAVADNHRNLGEIPAVVDMLVQDSLGDIPQLVHRGRDQVRFHRSSER